MKNIELRIKESISKQNSKAGKVTFKRYGSDHYRILQEKSVKARIKNKKYANK